VAVVLIWGSLHLAAARHSAGEVGFPLDDAWIHARIARNLAEGYGFAFNPGLMSAASTAPLWTLLLTLPAAAGVPFPWAAYLLGAAAALFLAWVVYRIATRAGVDTWAAAVISVTLVSTHPFPWSIGSGMEPALAAALALVALDVLSSRGLAPAMCLATVAGLARPELTLLPTVLLAAALLERPRVRRTRHLITLFGAAAATAAPFLVHWIIGGRLMPASFAAKVGRHGILAALAAGEPSQILPVLATNLPMYGGEVLRALSRDNLFLLLLAPLGFARLARTGRGGHAWWLLFLLQPIGMAVLAPFGAFDFHEQRYAAPVVALMTLAGCLGIVEISSRLWPPNAFPATAQPWHAASLFRSGALLLVLGLSIAGALGGMRRYAIEVKNIEEMQVKVARWLAARPEGPGTIATNDIGAIGYFTQAPIVDLTGLATPELIPILRRAPPLGLRNRGWNGANEAALLDYLRSTRPRFVALFPTWYPSHFFQQALGNVAFRVDLTDNLICGYRTMLVFRPDWDAGAP
jgi:hypothetical protein